MTAITEFLNALKADLLDRRLLPFIALVLVALAAAVGYVALGSGSSSAPPVGSPSVSASTGGKQLAVSQLAPEKAVDEVPTGHTTWHNGYARDPFLSVYPHKATTASTAAPSAAGSSSTSSSSASSGGSAPTSKAPSTTTPVKPKPQVVYHVAALFGLVTPGEASLDSQLTPFVNIPLLTPLPSAQQPLIVFRGVTTGGKSATFTVVGEVILHGNASCLPSAQQCEAIDLQVGKSEQMEYTPASGPTQVYELKIVSIAQAKASASSVQNLLKGESKAGRELLRRSGLVAIPYLHPSAQTGVLAFASRRDFSARAYGARRR